MSSRWLTVNCSSLQAVALQLRILWASVRWQDLNPEDDVSGSEFSVIFRYRDSLSEVPS